MSNFRLKCSKIDFYPCWEVIALRRPLPGIKATCFKGKEIIQGRKGRRKNKVRQGPKGKEFHALLLWSWVWGAEGHMPPGANTEGAPKERCGLFAAQNIQKICELC